MKLTDLFESKVAWKLIKEFPNYEVSTTGRVRTKSTEKDVAPWESKRRGGETDLRVSLYHEGVKKGRRVHRLVAQAFLPNPQNLLLEC